MPTGKVTTNLGTAGDVARSARSDAMGRLFLAGSTAAPDWAIVCYRPDGPLDAAFGSGGITLTDFGTDDEAGFGLAIGADNQPVVSGWVHTGDTTYDLTVVRYTMTGVLDGTFGTAGVSKTNFGGDNAWAYAVAIQADGKIVAVGAANTAPAGVLQFAVARFNIDGTLDTSFSGDGKVTTNFNAGVDQEALKVVIQADGKLVVGGYATIAGVISFALARFNTDGVLDSGFGTGGKVTTIFNAATTNFFALGIQADQKILAGGAVNAGGSVYDLAIARYNTDGSLDSTFGTTGKVSIPVLEGGLVTGFAVQPDSKILLSSYAKPEADEEDTHFAVVRLNVDGSLDDTFGTDGITITEFEDDEDYSSAFAIILQSSGKIILAGYAGPEDISDFAMARYTSSGELDITFGGDHMAQAPLIDHSGAKVSLNMAPALLSFSSDNYAVGAGGAATVVTADADAARPNIIRHIHCSYSAAPTGGGVKIEDGAGNTVFQMDISSAGVTEIDFPNPRSGTKNTAMIVTLLAPGGAVVGRLFPDIYRHK